jgi:hypothetical protein
MKCAAISVAVSSTLLLIVAGLYAGNLALLFKKWNIYEAQFGGKLKIDTDVIRYDIGGCTYAAFCICFIGKFNSFLF